MADTAIGQDDAAFLQALEQIKALVQAGMADDVTTEDVTREMSAPTDAAPRRERLLPTRTGYLPPLPTQMPARNALMPQTPEETDELSRDARNMGFMLEATGAAPAYRATSAALEGRPIDAVGNAAVAMMPYKPLMGIGTLGAAYAGAIANDLGAFDASTATAQQPKRPTGSTSLPGLAPAQQAEYDNARRKLEKGQFGSSAERRQLEQTMSGLRDVSNDFVRTQNAERVRLDTGAERSSQEEYNRAVQRAEAARDAELARDRRFSETNTGRLFEQTGGFAPFAFAVPAGILSRAATGGGRPLYDYGLPMASGAAAGISAANVPLGYNALFTEPDNPQRRAYEAYGRELPTSHPRRQEFLDYAQRLPTENPVRREAADQLYDPVRLLERSGLGLVEGVLGGLAGSETVRIPSRLLGRSSGKQSPPPPPPTGPTSSGAAPNQLDPSSVAPSARSSRPLTHGQLPLPPSSSTLPRPQPGPPEGATWNAALNRWVARGRIAGGPNRWAPPE